MTWYINVISYPKPVINRGATYFNVGGNNVPPGTYKVIKGTTISFSVSVVNKGGTGNCKISLIDSSTGSVLFSKEVSINSGGSVQLNGSINVSRDMALQFVTYYWNGSQWVQVDEYG